MNPQEQAVFDPFIPRQPTAKTKREVHLETLLILALPYIKREELSTRTSGYTRHLLAEIKGQVKGNT